MGWRSPQKVIIISAFLNLPAFNSYATDSSDYVSKIFFEYKPTLSLSYVELIKSVKFC